MSGGYVNDRVNRLLDYCAELGFEERDFADLAVAAADQADSTIVEQAAIRGILDAATDRRRRRAELASAPLSPFEVSCRDQMIAQLGGDAIFAMAFARDCAFEMPRSGPFVATLTLNVHPDLASRSWTGVTQVRICLDGSDTYRVSFLDGGQLKGDEIVGVYADQLQAVVERGTGLVLSFAQPRRAS